MTENDEKKKSLARERWQLATEIDAELGKLVANVARLAEIAQAQGDALHGLNEKRTNGLLFRLWEILPGRQAFPLLHDRNSEFIKHEQMLRALDLGEVN